MSLLLTKLWVFTSPIFQWFMKFYSLKTNFKYSKTQNIVSYPRKHRSREIVMQQRTICNPMELNCYFLPIHLDAFYVSVVSKKSMVSHFRNVSFVDFLIFYLFFIFFLNCLIVPDPNRFTRISVGSGSVLDFSNRWQ